MYRVIRLMSFTLKIFLKIIYTEIFKKLEQGIIEGFFEFRNAVDKRGALFGFIVLLQRCMDFNQ